MRDFTHISTWEKLMIHGEGRQVDVPHVNVQVVTGQKTKERRKKNWWGGREKSKANGESETMLFWSFSGRGS